MLINNAQTCKWGGSGRVKGQLRPDPILTRVGFRQPAPTRLPAGLPGWIPDISDTWQNVTALALIALKQDWIIQLNPTLGKLKAWHIHDEHYLHEY